MQPTLLLAASAERAQMLLLAAGAGLEQTLAARFDILVALQLWG